MAVQRSLTRAAVKLSLFQEKNIFVTNIFQDNDLSNGITTGM